MPRQKRRQTIDPEFLASQNFDSILHPVESELLKYAMSLKDKVAIYLPRNSLIIGILVSVTGGFYVAINSHENPLLQGFSSHSKQVSTPTRIYFSHIRCGYCSILGIFQRETNPQLLGSWQQVAGRTSSIGACFIYQICIDSFMFIPAARSYGRYGTSCIPKPNSAFQSLGT